MPTSGIATLCFFTVLMVTAVDVSGQAVGGAEVRDLCKVILESHQCLS